MLDAHQQNQVLRVHQSISMRRRCPACTACVTVYATTGLAPYRCWRQKPQPAPSARLRLEPPPAGCRRPSVWLPASRQDGSWPPCPRGGWRTRRGAAGPRMAAPAVNCRGASCAEDSPQLSMSASAHMRCGSSWALSHNISRRICGCMMPCTEIIVHSTTTMIVTVAARHCWMFSECS